MYVFMEGFALTELELCGIISLSEVEVRHYLGTSSAVFAMNDLSTPFLEATRLDERGCLTGSELCEFSISLIEVCDDLFSILSSRRFPGVFWDL